MCDFAGREDCRTSVSTTQRASRSTASTDPARRRWLTNSRRPLRASSNARSFAARSTTSHSRADIRYRRNPESGDSYFFDAFDYPSARAVLLDPLGPRGNRQFRLAAFDILSDRYVDAPLRTAAVDAVLLCDGVFLQRPELDDCWDFRVWVDAPFDVTVARAVARDAARGGGEYDVAARRARYERRYVPGQQIYLARCQPHERADVVVDNADLLNPSIRIQRLQ
jgi:uridine kinase